MQDDGIARPRMDLGIPEPVRTSMGRVVRGDESPESILARQPQGEFESGSTAMGMIPGAALAGGIPLGKVMRMKRDPTKVLDEMWTQYKSNTPQITKDRWIESLLNNLALSTYGDKHGIGGMVNSMEGKIQGINRMDQFGAILNMADRSGMLDASNLANATRSQGSHFGFEPNPRLLDELADYIQQIRPSKKR